MKAQDAATVISTQKEDIIKRGRRMTIIKSISELCLRNEQSEGQG
jgi:hypothetical protein